MVCNKNAASVVISLFLDMNYKQKAGVQLMESIALRLGYIMGTINEVIVIKTIYIFNLGFVF